MLRRARWFRTCALLWAALQLLLPLGTSLADARESRATAESALLAPGGHAEGSTGAQCRPTHSADCVVCRYLSDRAAPLAQWAVAAAEPQRAPAIPGRAPTLRPHHPAALPFSRAPPAV